MVDFNLPEVQAYACDTTKAYCVFCWMTVNVFDIFVMFFLKSCVMISIEFRKFIYMKRRGIQWGQRHIIRTG